MYGIQIGNKVFDKFTHPISNNYGLSNRSGEIDISKLGIIVGTDYFNRRLFESSLPASRVEIDQIKSNIPNDLFIRLNENIRITCPEDWVSDKLLIYVTGDIIKIGPLTNLILITG